MTKDKMRAYTIGSAIGKLCPYPHGRRRYGYGHWGYEFGYVLCIYKDGQSLFSMSLPPRVYIRYVKAIVKTIAETPMPLSKARASNIYYWLAGKTWRPPYSTREYPIMKEG